MLGVNDSAVLDDGHGETWYRQVVKEVKGRMTKYAGHYSTELHCLKFEFNVHSWRESTSQSQRFRGLVFLSKRFHIIRTLQSCVRETASADDSTIMITPS